METLEIELAYIHQLMDEEVARVLYQHCHWDVLANCAQLFDLDVSSLEAPLDVLPGLVMRKADEHLSKAKAKRFKAAWQQFTPLEQVNIALTVLENA